MADKDVFFLASMEQLIAVARGRTKADLLFSRARVINVFTGEIRETNVPVIGGKIAGIGDDYSEAHTVVDLEGKYLAPGLIDAHVHIESSMLTPAEYARAVLPHGTTAVICDPHEIVNVAGLPGLEFMSRAAAKTPLEFHFMIPSCIPATSLETTGAVFDTEKIWEAFKRLPASPGLAELMNYPGVISADPAVLSRIQIALGTDRLVDGHAPLLTGADLNAYVAAGIGTDHEVTCPEEALERVRLGLKVIIREGSVARNLESILPAVNQSNKSEFMFGTDDKHPGHLVEQGQVDFILKKAVAQGLDPATAVQLATINTARHYRLKGKGAIAPGYSADLVVFNDLERFEVLEVYKEGSLVARQGNVVEEPGAHRDENLENTVKLPDIRGQFALLLPESGAAANVISVKPGQIFTGWEKPPAEDVSVENDLLRIAVVERYGKSGNISVGLVRGFGLQQGALASTVSHDSHNLVVVGVDEQSMELAAEQVAGLGGGLAVACQEKILAQLPLPVGGLLSYEDALQVAARHNEVEQAATRLGCQLPAPFMAMSFLTLAVIPALKITDKGLVDVQKASRVSLWERD